MQFLEGAATGPNGQDSRTVRSAEQDPAGAGPEALGGRGSLMSRYRGAPPEDQATPPLPRTGEAPAGPSSASPPSPPRPPATPTTPPVGAPGAPADSPWRQSSWTAAPPVPPAPPAPPAAPVAPVAPADSAPVTDKPGADKPGADKPTADKPAADKPAEDAAPADEPAGDTRPPKDERPAEADVPKDTPAKPAVPGTRGSAPGTTAAGVGLLSTERTTEFKQRWRDLQADFVDDPQQAVRGAGELSKQILQALADTIADAERVDSWKAQDGTSGTEDLRVALRQYRTLVDRLLEL
jgi:hypothetical protein